MLENEVDGDAFLLLSEEHIKQLIKAIGPQVKFAQKHKFICASLADKQMASDNMILIMNYTYKSSYFQWISNSKEKMRLFWQSGSLEKDSVRV